MLFIFEKLELLLESGKPRVIGVDKWERELTAILLTIQAQTYAVFGEEMLDSVNEIPNGCTRLWLYFTRLYIIALDLHSILKPVALGESRKGINKSVNLLDDFTDTIAKLSDERNTILSYIAKINLSDDTVKKAFGALLVTIRSNPLPN